MTNALFTVVAFDPGITTGYAMGDLDEEVGELLVVSGEQKWMPSGLWEFLNEYKPDFLICEDFLFRNNSRRGLELYPRELIGICKLFSQISSAPRCELVMQPPRPTQFFSDERLKLEHIYKPGHPHANDAVRHMLHWFQFGQGFKYNKNGYRGAA